MNEEWSGKQEGRKKRKNEVVENGRRKRGRSVGKRKFDKKYRKPPTRNLSSYDCTFTGEFFPQTFFLLSFFIFFYLLFLESMLHRKHICARCIDLTFARLNIAFWQELASAIKTTWKLWWNNGRLI